MSPTPSRRKRSFAGGETVFHKRTRRNTHQAIEEAEDCIVVATTDGSEPAKEVEDEGNLKPCSVSEDSGNVIPEDSLDPQGQPSRVEPDNATQEVQEALKAIPRSPKACNSQSPQGTEESSSQPPTSPKPRMSSMPLSSPTLHGAHTGMDAHSSPDCSPGLENRPLNATPEVPHPRQPQHPKPHATINCGESWPAQQTRKTPIQPPLPPPQEAMPVRRRPEVLFTIDNRIESSSPSDAQSLVDTFAKNTSVFLPPITPETRPYPVGVIMWRALPDFCSWYSKEIGAPQAMTKAVKIELIDVSSALKTTFKIPLNISADDFRKLKQSIWDIFWEPVSLRGQERTFRLMISALATENVGSKSLNAPTWQTPSPRPHSSPLRIQAPPTQPTKLDRAGMHASAQQLVRSTPSSSTHTPDIKLRLQTDRTGKLGLLFDKIAPSPTITNLQFFAWFAIQTGYARPEGPPLLRFMFKDAMPDPKVCNIEKGNESFFKYIWGDIKAQCETAMCFIPGLKEFTILVTVPDWVDGKEEVR